MNHAKIAAALHALADAFLEGVEDQPAPAKGKGKGKASAAEPALATSAATISGYAAPAAPPTSAPPSTPPVAPAVPSITKDQLNKAVLKVAAKSRDAAEAILAKFGQKNTVTLPAELWQAVYDAFEEEIARQDAAAVQVAQSSLV